MCCSTSRFSHDANRFDWLGENDSDLRFPVHIRCLQIERQSLRNFWHETKNVHTFPVQLHGLLASRSRELCLLDPRWRKKAQKSHQVQNLFDSFQTIGSIHYSVFTSEAAYC